MLVQTRDADPQTFLRVGDTHLLPLDPNRDHFYGGTWIFTTYRPAELFRWRTLTEMEDVPLRLGDLKRVAVKTVDDIVRCIALLSNVPDVIRRDAFSDMLWVDVRISVDSCVDSQLRSAADSVDFYYNERTRDAWTRVRRALRDDVLRDAWPIMNAWPRDPEDEDRFILRDCFTEDQVREYYTLTAQQYTTVAASPADAERALRVMIATYVHNGLSSSLTMTYEDRTSPLLTSLRKLAPNEAHALTAA